MTTSSPPTDSPARLTTERRQVLSRLKSPVRAPQFLQIVAKPKRAAARVMPEAKPEPEPKRKSTAPRRRQ